MIDDHDHVTAADAGERRVGLREAEHLGTDDVRGTLGAQGEILDPGQRCLRAARDAKRSLSLCEANEAAREMKGFVRQHGRGDDQRALAANGSRGGT